MSDDPATNVEYEPSVDEPLEPCCTYLDDAGECFCTEHQSSIVHPLERLG